MGAGAHPASPDHVGRRVASAIAPNSEAPSQDHLARSSPINSVESMDDGGVLALRWAGVEFRVPFVVEKGTP